MESVPNGDNSLTAWYNCLGLCLHLAWKTNSVSI